MLDTQTQIAPAPVALQGQRVIVLGACCGFGRGVIRGLGAAGAQVVAADTNGALLAQMEGAVPLPLKTVPDVALRRVGRAWGAVQLDAIVNLMPLRAPQALDLNVAVLQALVQGFLPALAPCEGQIITVVARPDAALDVAAGAMAPALASAQSVLSRALSRDGLRLNLVEMGQGGMTPARMAVLGLLGGQMGPLTGAEVRV